MQSVTNILKTTAQSLWHRGYLYVWANVAFFVACLPIITLPSAYFALWRLMYTLHKEPDTANMALFWETFKQNFWQSTLWGALNLAFAIVHISNMTAYANNPEPLFRVLNIVWGVILFLWLGILLYSGGIYAAMQTPNVWEATKNAFVMVLRHPFFTLFLMTLVMLLVSISLWFLALWVVLTVSMIASLSSATTIELLYQKNTK